MRGLHLTVRGWKQWLTCRGQLSDRWMTSRLGKARPGMGAPVVTEPSTLWPFCVGIMVPFFCHSRMRMYCITVINMWSPAPQTLLYQDQHGVHLWDGWLCHAGLVQCHVTLSCEVCHKTTVQTHRGPTRRNRTIDIHVIYKETALACTQPSLLCFKEVTAYVWDDQYLMRIGTLKLWTAFQLI